MTGRDEVHRNAFGALRIGSRDSLYYNVRTVVIAESPLPYERIHSSLTNKWRPVFLMGSHARREVESVDSYSYEGGGVMKVLLEKWSLVVFSFSGRYLSL